MDLDLNENSKLNDSNEKSENSQSFYYYMCSNCDYLFCSKLKIKNKEKFCRIDCRASWVIRKYDNSNECLEILSQNLEDEYVK